VAGPVAVETDPTPVPAQRGDAKHGRGWFRVSRDGEQVKKPAQATVMDDGRGWFRTLLGGEQTVFRGHDGVREMLRDLNEAFGEIHIEISEIRDLGDRLVAIGRTRAHGKASGAEPRRPWPS
jgi:hypothetical protein